VERHGVRIRAPIRFARRLAHMWIFNGRAYAAERPIDASVLGNRRAGPTGLVFALVNSCEAGGEAPRAPLIGSPDRPSHQHPHALHHRLERALPRSINSARRGPRSQTGRELILQMIFDADDRSKRRG
jgi:hypothetical protein